MQKHENHSALPGSPFESIEQEVQEIARRQAEARKTIWKVGKQALEGDPKAQAEFRGAATQILLAQIFYGEEMRDRGLDHPGVGEDTNEE